jgi:cytochrome c553
MKKILLVFPLVLFPLFNIAEAQVKVSYSEYKYYMHKVLDGYTHARISYNLKNYEVADIYLKHVLGYLKEVSNYIPEQTSEGVKLDKGLLIKRLNELKQKISDLRTSVQKKELKEIKQYSQEIFDMCVECHKDAKRKKYLFSQVIHEENLFEEYMHKISEHFDTARIYAEHKEFGETEDYFKLINFYVQLLEDVIPNKGPSGIILDRDGFILRLRDLKKMNENFQKDIKEKKKVDLAAFKKSLNDLCVACHEPERIK